MEGQIVINPRVEELFQRHRALERKIEQEMSRPSADNLRISELKRRKLRLKEKIIHIESKSTH